MKFNRLLGCALPLSGLMLVACNGSSSSSSNNGADIVVTPSSLVLTPGESKEIVTSVADGNTLSSAQTISISDNGNVQYATISSTPTTCTLSNALRSCTFTVTALSTLGTSELNVSNSGNASLSANSIKLTVAESVVEISLPQTGQLLQMPTGCPDNQVTCVASPPGSDGYGRLINGFNIPYGVTWAYNGDMPLNPAVRFINGTESGGQPCPTGQETRVDNLTGLMWVQSLQEGVPELWVDGNGQHPALQAVANYNANKFCGYDDWRMPNVNELASLLNYGVINQSVWLNDSAQGFQGIAFDYYWTSTAGSDNYEWRINMLAGDIGQTLTIYTPGKEGHTAYVWPVRGGE